MTIVALTSASLGEVSPKNILVAPFVYDGQVVGVVEMGTLTEFTPAQMEFLDKALESIAIAFTTAQARARVNELLTQTQPAGRGIAGPGRRTAGRQRGAGSADREPARLRGEAARPTRPSWKRPTPSWKRAAPPCTSRRRRSTGRTRS